MGGFQHEITAHVETGMSTMDAIVASTGESAQSCWIDDTVGTLEVGKQADVLIIDGNPLEDINTLWNVADVFQAGDHVDRGNFI
jgi:imidazolonepropionase-like amidohydrolase